jgi:hypothetical protein
MQQTQHAPSPLPQATRAGALVHQEQARQLSADASTLLQSLGNTQDITAGSAWPLLRPLLRLLLWLLPEHVPLPLTDAAMSQSQPSETGQSRHSTAAPTAVGQWRQEVASSYVQAVVTVGDQGTCCIRAWLKAGGRRTWSRPCYNQCVLRSSRVLSQSHRHTRSDANRYVLGLFTDG